MFCNRKTSRDLKTIATKSSVQYYKTYMHLKKTEYYSKKAISEIQFSKIRKILEYAYSNVKYYNSLFKKNGISPNEFKNILDIKKIPFLNKETLRKNNKLFLTKKYSKIFTVKVYTGGTTGSPLPLFRSIDDFAREQAYNDFVCKLQGVDPLSKRVHIRGEVADRKGIHFSFSKINNTLYLSSNNLSKNNLKKYLSLINEYNPEVIYSLPSIATIISEFIKENNVKLTNSIKFALIVSENLYPFQKEIIEDAFRCKIIRQYGHSERCVIACPCDRSDYYHVLPQYGYVELIDGKGDLVEKEGEIGEIVATSFTNKVFPLIRYRTGDFAEYSKNKCNCNRNYQLWKKIIGRGQAIAYTKSKTKISIGPDLLCSIYNDDYSKIKQFKIEQNQIGKLIINFKSYKNNRSDEIQNFFYKLFDQQYPNCFDISTVEKDDDYFNKTEKRLYFVQNIS